MADGPINRPQDPASDTRSQSPQSGETRCESCGKRLAPGNSTLFKGFCDDCAQKNARSMFF